MAPEMEQTAATSSTIGPFRVEIPEETVADLRRRIANTRFADREVVPDQSQGVQLATIQELARYWGSDYDMGRLEARLNALPQFKTEIDGLDIYFIHVRSKHDDALPLIVTHGWPGSVIELLNTIDPLTNPTAHGGSASDAFHLVIPSMPGYGFSARPTAPGWNPQHIGRAWDTLMKRLGYERYVSQGGDWGAFITELMQRQAPAGLIGVHINFLFTRPPEIARALALGEPAPAGHSEAEKAAYEQLHARGQVGYLIEQGTRPQTIGQGLSDSPVGLAAWLLDHDPRSYEKMVHAFEGHPEGELTRDQILDDIMLYWVTHTETSAARLYWETKVLALKASESGVPVAMTVFPDESYRAPRSWLEQVYPNVIYYHQVDRGGHFAAWEQPELFSSELRAAFGSLR
jgi:pimeloyl-ACP methyl ester carboxylesterase